MPVSSTVVLQANAAFVKPGIGLHPGVVLVIMMLVDMVLDIIFICDAFAMQSKHTEEKMQKAPLLGLYSSAVIGWILLWDRRLSILFITLGWIGISVVLMLVAPGYIRVIF